jgi:hypothetical protein
MIVCVLTRRLATITERAWPHTFDFQNNNELVGINACSLTAVDAV